MLQPNRCACAHTQPGGRSDCMCVQVYRGDCFYVCCSQKVCLPHTQPGGRSDCVCADRWLMQVHAYPLLVWQSATDRTTKTKCAQPTLVNGPVMSPVAALWPHPQRRNCRLVLECNMLTGMALSYAGHIKWYCQLVSQISGRPPQPTLYVPAEQVSGQAETPSRSLGKALPPMGARRRLGPPV